MVAHAVLRTNLNREGLTRVPVEHKVAASLKLTTDRGQTPLPSATEGEWWSTMPEIFHPD